MKLTELLREAGVPFEKGKFDENIEIGGICSHSKRVKQGDVFVAIRGLNSDGAQYVEEALQRGAAFIISERELEIENGLCVKNTRAALACLWDAWYAHPAKDLLLVGVTGTNGKTSVSTMLWHILHQNGKKVGLIGTVECRLGDRVLSGKAKKGLANMTTPDPDELYAILAQMRDLGAQYVIMEVTSHALALEKVEPLHFKCAVFTNLTQDHMDFHGDMEHYFLEKCKLFDKCEKAVISFRTPYGIRLSERIKCPFEEVSSKTVRDICYYGIDGISFSLHSVLGGSFVVQAPLPGEFSVENTALAALSAKWLSVDCKGIQKALASFGGVRGRMERVGENPFGITVFLDYAHTPDALEKLLLCVRGFLSGEGRVILVFGCGGERDRSKRAEMGRIASRLSDFVVITSDNARSEDPDRILEDIMRGVDKERAYCVIKDRKEAIRYAVFSARAGDVLLLAGKGHEEYELRGGERFYFSEREIIKEAFQERQS